jgi:2-keto-3-deoxy-galactonokinase
MTTPFLSRHAALVPEPRVAGSQGGLFHGPPANCPVSGARMQWTTREGWMTAPFLSYHAAIAGLANMVTAISAGEKSLLTASPPLIVSGLGRISVLKFIDLARAMLHQQPKR